MHYKQMSELYSAIRRFVEDSGYDVSLSLSGLMNQMAESGRVGFCCSIKSSQKSGEYWFGCCDSAERDYAYRPQL